MKIEDFYTYRRWAVSMQEEALNRSKEMRGTARQSAVDAYWYLAEWVEAFDRASQCFCWNEGHINYQSGVRQIKALINTL